MTKKITIQNFPDILSVFIILLIGLISKSNAASLEFNPSSVQLDAGESVLVEVIAKDIPATGLAAFQFNLQFDPAVINIIDPNLDSGGALPAYVPLGNNIFCAYFRKIDTCTDSDWMLILTERDPLPYILDDTPGNISILYSTSGDNAPPTGTGVIALLEIVGIADGRVSIELTNVILADDNNPPVEHSTTLSPLSVQIGPVNPPPALPVINTFLLLM